MFKAISKVNIAIAAVSFLTVLISPALAETRRMRVDIPFPFTAGDQAMPAGKYYVDVLEQARMMKLEGWESSVRIPVRDAGARRTGNPDAKGALLFEKSGDRYVLRSAWGPGRAQGYALHGSKSLEQELSKGSKGAGVLALVR